MHKEVGRTNREGWRDGGTRKRDKAEICMGRRTE